MEYLLKHLSLVWICNYWLKSKFSQNHALKNQKYYLPLLNITFPDCNFPVCFSIITSKFRSSSNTDNFFQINLIFALHKLQTHQLFFLFGPKVLQLFNFISGTFTFSLKAFISLLVTLPSALAILAERTITPIVNPICFNASSSLSFFCFKLV